MVTHPHPHPHMHTAPSDEDRSAICWSRDRERETKSCYWTREILDLFRPFRSVNNDEVDVDDEVDEVNADVDVDADRDGNENSNRSRNEDGIKNKDGSSIATTVTSTTSTSYRTLLLLAAGVVRQIREEYCGSSISRSLGNIGVDNNNNNNNDSNNDSNNNGNDTDEKNTHRDSERESVAFAVAIPEGPMLPLAILVVHALNVTVGLRPQQQHESCCSFSPPCYAVLVPLDPDEGKDRNLHILNDSGPSFVLAVPGKDSNKLRDLIEKHDGGGGDGIGNGDDDELATSTRTATATATATGATTTTTTMTTTTRLVNFVELVGVARKRLESMSVSILSSSSSMVVGNTSSTTTSLDCCTYGQLIASGTASSLQQLVSDLATRITDPSSPVAPCQDLPDPNNSDRHKEDETLPSSSPSSLPPLRSNKISHVVYTSGTTGRPKGCVSSTRSLLNYVACKNSAHDVTNESTVLLASSLSFDPCLSDIVATFDAKATLAIVPRDELVSGLTSVLQNLSVTHVLCTPTLWSLTLTALLVHRSHSGTAAVKKDFPRLQRVALGGEPIPKSIVQAWARSRAEEQQQQQQQNGSFDEKSESFSSCRLLATYGVTEACVYQTCGELFRRGKAIGTDSAINTAVAKPFPPGPGQCVGYVLEGTKIKICKEEIRGSCLEEVAETGMRGEIVLSGDQVDVVTGYLNRPDLEGKFVAEEVVDTENCGTNTSKTVIYHYRTGDRGYINPDDGSLSILSRIVGEEGMVKVNGVRVELGEIEAAVMSGDDQDGNGEECPVVTDCLAKVVKTADGQSAIHAYCVFGEMVWTEIGISQNDARSIEKGIIINGGPLWSLLRVKCSNRLRKACIPSTIVGIHQLPLSRTGKRDRSGLPGIDSCSILNISNQMSTPLEKYGLAGSAVVETLVQYLNLQPCQQEMLTKSVSFAVLGGDSLSAPVVCRTLYARFHQIQNTRFVGGQYGQLPEPFNTATLLCAQNLGDYVDLLDESIATNGLDRSSGTSSDNPSPTVSSATTTGTTNVPENGNTDNKLLYDALLQAITLNQSSIAVALLNLGADPNHGYAHGSRLGNTSGRINRRATFKTTPLHLACFRGDDILVKHLLQKNASYKSPNTNGLFPIHLAAGVLDDNGLENATEGDVAHRLECVKLLLTAGCPLLIKDANKQSILHAAARAGHRAIIEFVIVGHQSDRYYTGPVPLRQFLEFQDRWFRSAVHWATINGRVGALKLLLDKGCDPMPYKPSPNKQTGTSMIAETPLEICQRLHGGTNEGIEMEKLLRMAIDSRNAS